MMMPEHVQHSSRCKDTDLEGIALRVRAATWTCPTCGVMEPTVQILAGYEYIHAQRCACLAETQRTIQAEGEAVQVVAQRDRVRMERAIGGMEPGMRAWDMRFATFQTEVRRDAWETCVAWTQYVIHTARQVQHEVEQQSQVDGRPDPMAYQIRFRPAWLHALAQVPNLVLLGASGLGKPPPGHYYPWSHIR